MTIAVGFRCLDGLVLAVDSELSTDTARYDGEKAWLLRYPDDRDTAKLQVAVVGSGDAAFIHFAAERLADALNAEMGLDQVQATVQRVIDDIHRDHLYPYPDANTRPEIFLLVGIKAHDGSRMLITSLTTVTQVNGYEAVGAGRDLGRFIIKRFHSVRQPGKLSVSDTVFASAQVLMHARDNVLGCGGQSKVIAIYDDAGPSGFVNMEEIGSNELYAQRLDAAFQTVLIGATDAGTDDPQYQRLLRRLAKELTAFRKRRNVGRQAKKVRGAIVRAGLSADLSFSGNLKTVHTRAGYVQTLGPTIAGRAIPILRATRPGEGFRAGEWISGMLADQKQRDDKDGGS